jgi:hypothetical protein
VTCVFLAVVAGGGQYQMMYLEIFFQQLDKRQEVLPVEAAHIQLVRGSVGSHYEAYSFFYQRGEKGF